MSYVSADLPRGARRTTYDVPGGPLAAGGWRVVAIDLRGQHESVGPEDPQAYGVDALAADVVAVAGLLEAPVHLLGHSFGGLVCRRAVLLQPDAFRSLVLLASGPQALTGPRVDVLAFLPGVIAQGGMAAVADASEAMSDADGLGRPLPEPVRAFLRTRWLTSSPVGLMAMGEALRTEPDRVEELRATGVPVLVAHGEHDDAWSPQVQAEMAVRLGAAHEVVAGAVHSPAVEQPESTAKALLAFWG